jgi:hypothetical protein
VVKQVRKWSTTWCRAFNNLRISEFSSYWPSFVCMDSRKEKCECVIMVVWSNPQSTLWKTRRYLTNSAVSSNKAVITDADLLSFLTHTHWSNNCGQWRNNKNNINDKEITLTFIPQIFIHHCPILESSSSCINRRAFQVMMLRKCLEKWVNLDQLSACFGFTRRHLLKTLYYHLLLFLL